METHHWTGGTGLCSPSPGDPPPAPQDAAGSPCLGDAPCAPPEAAQVRETDPISFVTLQEQRCVLSWFQGWSGAQRERFLQDLLGKAVPGKMCTLLDSFGSLQVKDHLPSIFECQLRLWNQWFESWGEEERNRFLDMLEEKDPLFVSHFFSSVVGTAGRE